MIITVKESGKQYRRNLEVNKKIIFKECTEIMKTISIIGSCVSRDIFNSKFIKNWREFFQVKCYYARTTIPSIISKPMTYNLDVLEKNFNPTKFETVYSECAKRILDTIRLNQTDCLLMDFYADAFYGTYDYLDGYYGGWSFGRLIKKNILPSKESYKLYRYDLNVDLYFSLWCRCFDLFMSFMKNNCPETTIIINGVKGSNVFTNAKGDFEGIQIKDLDVSVVNGLWKKMDSYASEKYGLSVIDYEKEYTLNKDYIYAGTAELVHFHQAYYDDAFTKLVKCCAAKENTRINKINNNTYFNLLRNPGFQNELRFWSRKKGKWEIRYINGKCWAMSLYDDSVKWKYIWSDPVEIDNDGEKKFRLSFEFIILEDGLKGSDALFLFAVLGFKKGVYKTNKEACYEEVVSVERKDYKANTEYKYSMTFKPDGKYLRVAPHTKDSGILFTNIQLTRIDEDV